MQYVWTVDVDRRDRWLQCIHAEAVRFEFDAYDASDWSDNFSRGVQFRARLYRQLTRVDDEAEDSTEPAENDSDSDGAASADEDTMELLAEDSDGLAEISAEESAGEAEDSVNESTGGAEYSAGDQSDEEEQGLPDQLSEDEDTMEKPCCCSLWCCNNDPTHECIPSSTPCCHQSIIVCSCCHQL